MAAGWKQIVLESDLDAHEAVSDAHHPRAHYMNASLDHVANTWKLFYSNGSGLVAEVSLGADGTVLTSTGTGSIPAFEAPSGGGVMESAFLM